MKKILSIRKKKKYIYIYAHVTALVIKLFILNHLGLTFLVFFIRFTTTTKLRQPWMHSRVLILEKKKLLTVRVKKKLSREKKKLSREKKNHLKKKLSRTCKKKNFHVKK